MKSDALRCGTNINICRKTNGIKATAMKKRSLGNLRTAVQSKPNSPSSVGDIRIQKDTLLILMKQLNEQKGNEIICNLAGWRNVGKLGPFLTVELSPRFVRKATNTTSAASQSQKELQ